MDMFDYSIIVRLQVLQVQSSGFKVQGCFFFSSSIQYQVSSIQLPASCILYRASNTQYPEIA